jgi:NAD(P)-dependent dehydrogenase (short-subunit alcohol dehydrogenase family)
VSRFDNQVVVVTGAGRGIGAAYARMFAAQGAMVVVNDLDADAARESAETIGGLAVDGDASSEAGVEQLIGTVRELAGPIDVYCANAGVAHQGLVDAAEEAWEKSWQVNVMAHVRPSKALIPQWVSRGGGMFVSTISAAGLLTIPGSAPYAVTKHAAYAYAEWLSMTYADAGVRVHAVCPQACAHRCCGTRVRWVGRSWTSRRLRLTTSPHRCWPRSRSGSSWSCPTLRLARCMPVAPLTPIAGLMGCDGCAAPCLTTDH